MSSWDQYSEEGGLEADDFFTHIQEEPKSDIERYIQSMYHLSESVDAIRNNPELSLNEKLDRINSLRRTSYLTNSTYFEEIVKTVIAKTPLQEFVDNHKKLLEMNKDYLVECGLESVKSGGAIEIYENGKLFLREEMFIPDHILLHYNITEDNQLDYHLLAGFLLAAENSDIIHKGLSILSVSDKIEESFSR